MRRGLAIDHVQLAMPIGGEDAARAFYNILLGIGERAKPAALAGRGGCWFEDGALRVHLGVEANFRAARKAHIALEVPDLASLRARLSGAGVDIVDDEPLDGSERFYADDPFGNRLEFLEPRR